MLPTKEAKAALKGSRDVIKSNLSEISTQKDERYAVYDKMRKMLPEGAVRQKMDVDGFLPMEIDAYFSSSGDVMSSSSSAVPQPLNQRDIAVEKQSRPPVSSRSGERESPAQAALSGDSRLKTYDTMRKMLPEGAVRQKMKMDGIPDADIDAYFGAGSNVSAPSNR